ncbi:MAG: acyl carrier protein [Clostridia bacterium]|nr:acyl carrier protein [Clostridia bacterium]
MIFEKITAILADQLDAEADKMTPATKIADDLGADSLDLVDLLMSIEDEFGVEIPDEEVENLTTIGDVVDYISEHSN